VSSGNGHDDEDDATPAPVGDIGTDLTPPDGTRVSDAPVHLLLASAVAHNRRGVHIGERVAAMASMSGSPYKKDFLKTLADESGNAAEAFHAARRDFYEAHRKCR
jgi:hypothetical protein